MVQLRPLMGVVGLGVLVCLVVIAALAPQGGALVLESAGSEHAVENSFFDNLAARDLAKDRRSHNSKDLHSSHMSLTAKQERAVEDRYFKGAAAGKAQSQLAGVHAAHKLPVKLWKVCVYCVGGVPACTTCACV